MMVIVSTLGSRWNWNYFMLHNQVYRTKSKLLLHLVWVFLCVHCSQKNRFEEEKKAKGSESKVVSENSFDAQVDLQQCIKSPRFKQDLPKDLQTCMGLGRNFMWNFYRPEGEPVLDKCIQVVNPTFDCNFDNLINAASGIFDDENHQAVQELKSYKDKSFLVSCAENNEGRTIVAQFVKLDEDRFNPDCSLISQNIQVTTRCYQKTEENTPSQSDDPAVISKETRDCLR
tara:strand:+ start:59 stop:745 length:687 start_codon:yes stop_codon:yes gene_type:complete